MAVKQETTMQIELTQSSFDSYRYRQNLFGNRMMIAMSALIVLFYLAIDPISFQVAEASFLFYLRVVLFLPVLAFLFTLTFLNVPRHFFYFAAILTYTTGGLAFLLIDNLSPVPHVMHGYVSVVHAIAFMLIGVVVPPRYCIPAALLLYGASLIDLYFSPTLAPGKKLAFASGITGAVAIMVLWVYIRERDTRSLYKNEQNVAQADRIQERWGQYFLKVMKRKLHASLNKIKTTLPSVGQTDPAHKYIERCLHTLQQCENLVDKLLDSVSWRNALSARQTDNISSSDFLLSCLKDFEEVYPGATFKLDTDSHFCVTGDETLLKRAISNLVDNAVRLHQPGTEIVLGTTRARSFFVSNEGSSIPKDIKEIFQYGISGSAGSGGLFGIGLFLAQQICINHDALLYARQHDNKVCFYIEFSG